LNNGFPEYQDVVDEIAARIGCPRLRIIQRGSRLSENRSDTEAGTIVMRSGIGKEEFASVLTEEICHVCIAPGSRKEEIITALMERLDTDRQVAYYSSMLAADIVCENHIFRDVVLNQLRQPKIRSLLSALDSSPSLREVQAIFAQLRALDFPKKSSLWNRVEDVLDSEGETAGKCIEIGALLYPIVSREFEEERKKRSAP
jgi:hypothetical protein